MTSPTTDRRFGVNGGLAFKAPVRAATTANITLSGLQTIDGISLAADDRVLVKDQTTSADNGIYVVSSSAWSRDVDANGNRDLAKGTTVYVTDGSTLAGSYWAVSTANPITVGTSSLSWARSLSSSISTLSFLQSGTGAVSRGAQDKMRETLSVADFGVAFDNSSGSAAANWAAFQLVFAVATALGGATLELSLGTAYCNAPLVYPHNTTIRGKGKLASGVVFTHAGDGFVSRTTINSSVGVRSGLRDLFISCNNGSNTGGGIVDVGGSYMDFHSVYVENFKYQIVLDQTEIATVDICDLNQHRVGDVGIWLVNGSDHTPGVTFTVAPALGATSGTLTGAWSGTSGTYNLNFVETVGGAAEPRSATLTNGSASVTWDVALTAACNAATTAGSTTSSFTNRITISRNQLNAVTGAFENILDDGGANHTIADNNANGGRRFLRAAGVYGLSVSGNEIEVHDTDSILLTNTTLAARRVGACYGPDIFGANVFLDQTASHISIDEVQGGRVTANVFGQATAASINFNNAGANPSTGLVIEGNAKVIMGAAKQAAQFVDGNSAVIKNQTIRQVGMTYVVSALGSTGSQTVTPASMEGIRNGMTLVCQNTDGTNEEIVTVTAVAATTFTATFASTKSANWMVNATRPASNELFGSATFDPPSLADGAGSTTTVTVTGAALGDRVSGVTFSLDLQGITVTAYVSSANTVSVRFQNESGGLLDLSSGTLKVWVIPQ